MISDELRHAVQCFHVSGTASAALGVVAALQRDGAPPLFRHRLERVLRDARDLAHAIADSTDLGADEALTEGERARLIALVCSPKPWWVMELQDVDRSLVAAGYAETWVANSPAKEGRPGHRLRATKAGRDLVRDAELLADAKDEPVPETLPEAGADSGVHAHVMNDTVPAPSRVGEGT